MSNTATTMNTITDFIGVLTRKGLDRLGNTECTARSQLSSSRLHVYHREVALLPDCLATTRQNVTVQPDAGWGRADLLTASVSCYYVCIDRAQHFRAITCEIDLDTESDRT